MEVISVANQKGGCGKTTTSVNLSRYLALKGKRMLLIDIDPQGASTTSLGIDKKNLEKTTYNTFLDGSDLIGVTMPTKFRILTSPPPI